MLPNWKAALSTFPSATGSMDTDEFPSINMSTKPFVIIVKGPKRTGKSTFARLLLNRLATVYRRVAYLECDLGQTEFCPPGLVALNVIEHPILGEKLPSHSRRGH